MPETGEDNGKLKLSNRYFSFGIQVAGSFAFYLLGGYWLDIKFSTLPLFLIIGIIFGVISFIYFMRKLYRQE